MEEIKSTQIENWAKENAAKYEDALKKLAKGQEDDSEVKTDDKEQ